MSKTPKNENCKTLIYVLKDPDTDEIRYVGKTVDKLENRLKGHLYRSKIEENHRAFWIKSLVNNEKEPKIEEIDSCEWNKSQDLEIYYIKYYKELGCKLVNSTDGGEGNLGLIKSKETIAKLKESLRKNSKIVYQYDLEGNFIKEWPNSSEAAETLHITYAGIRRCALKERKKYKNFIWSYDKLNNITPYERNSYTPQKGYTHSDLSKLIKLEENLIKCNNVYCFLFGYNEEDLVFEARSLREMSEWLINNNHTTANVTTLRNRISQCCLTNTPYLNNYWFTNTTPDFITSPKSNLLINIKAYDLEDNLLFDINGLDNFCNTLEINKVNVINNLKGKTKNILFNNQKIYLKWEEIQ